MWQFVFDLQLNPKLKLKSVFKNWRYSIYIYSIIAQIRYSGKGKVRNCIQWSTYNSILQYPV